MLFKAPSLVFATIAAFSTFIAVGANIAPHAGPMGLQARAELFHSVADMIERSETEKLDARHELQAFAEFLTVLLALLASTSTLSATGVALFALESRCHKLDSLIPAPYHPHLVM
ncbi:hypothetical protein BKA70DRAFT_15384 [Coprinopsis sp. MPI-PUGE-AT-0042]|nr:hypothetical protein BKA70DRAFT_15384 [Coprinopsis sp. MPI-PUGE-AT-0042]